MNNIATPTVSGPTVQLQGLNPNGLLGAIAQTAEIPKVSCVADAKNYPGKAGTQDVLLDTNDPDIAYFRSIDVNGFVCVDRRRCVPEPEPTQEELNDQRYLSRQEFADFMDQFKAFREEMSENVRVFTAAASAADFHRNDRKSNGNGQKHGNDQANASRQNPNAGTPAVTQPTSNV